MGVISTYINDRKTTGRIHQVVNTTLATLMYRSKVLNHVAPRKEYRDRSFKGLLHEQISPIAQVVGFGQEIPTTRVGQFTEVNAQMVKIAQRLEYDENLQWQMFEALEKAQFRNITVEDITLPDGTTRAGSNHSFAMTIFGSYTKLAQSIMDRLDLMTWQAIYSGKVSIAKGDQTILLNYRNDAEYPNAFPAPLTGTARWSQYATANGLDDLYTLHEGFTERNGYPPDAFVMSRKDLHNLRMQESTKNAATQVVGRSVGTVGIEMLNSVLENLQLCKIIVEDSRYQILTDSKKISQARFLPQGTVALVKANAGQRAIGCTMESSTTQIRDGSSVPQPRPGLFIDTYQEKRSPVLDVTYGTLVGLPIFLDPKLLSAQVIDGEV